MRNLSSVVIQYLMLLICSVPLSSMAAAGATMPSQRGMGQAQFDWVKHTQVTLDELKAKLNLTPAQGSAWSAWSAGVLGDAHRQFGARTEECHRTMRHSNGWVSESTPDQMTRGIACLRAETTWMQAHLAQFEAAQVRTKTFYDVLDSNQKTIFDLFWHVMYHRVSGPCRE